MRYSNGSSLRRRGFTLVELLMVTGILCILVAIGAGAYSRVVGSQTQKRSENTVRSLQAALEKQRQAALDDIKNEINSSVSSGANYAQSAYAAAYSAAGSSSNNTDLVNALYTKIRLTQEFPTSFGEALNLPAGAKPAYQSYLKNVTVGATPAPLESAVCLYMALTLGRRGANFNADDVGPSTTGNISVGSQSFTVFVDGWGNPITYERWTIDSTIFDELSQPPYAPAGATYTDSDDPFNAIQSWSSKASAPTYLTASPYVAYATANSGLAAQPNYGISGQNRGPVVRSWGKDGLSIYSSNQLNLADDILGFRLMSAGQRGN